MIIHLIIEYDNLHKNKHTLTLDDFKFKCCIGKNVKVKKKEGDKKTPIGYFEIENLYYRADRIKKPSTNLKSIKFKNTWDGVTIHLILKIITS